MTSAQKTAKVKFKQAIAYRQKTGVSLKEAFAKIYGKKKITTVKKKSAPKKKKIGESNIPKATMALGNKLWDMRSKSFQDQFVGYIDGYMDSAKNLGYTFAQCKTAIKFVVGEIIEFEKPNY